MVATLRALCEDISADVTYGTNAEPIGENMNGWTVRLRYNGRQLTVPFFTGYGLSGEPSASDVVECLLDDAASYDNAGGFEEWAGDLGYDRDSRSAERVYKACGRISRRLHRFLGDDFDTFTEADR